ncbi:MAG: UMP kinase [Candidatus Aenigmatarchaeota archaeon]
MKIVIKIGGSLSIGKNGPRFKYFKKLLPILKKIDKEHQLILVIGGGKLIRKYYDAIKKFNLSNEEMEWIAIDMLRVNVRFLSFLMKKKPIFRIEELNEKSEGIIGGVFPGRSTDANAAYAAKAIKADLLIKLTDVDGIYDKDPKRFKNTKKIDNLSFDELRNYINDEAPGSYGILDRLAIETIIKNKIKTIIMNGKKPENLLKVLKGEKIGTLIS